MLVTIQPRPQPSSLRARIQTVASSLRLREQASALLPQTHVSTQPLPPDLGVEVPTSLTLRLPKHLALCGAAADSDDFLHQLLLLQPHSLLHRNLTEGVHGVLHAIGDHSRLVRLYSNLCGGQRRHCIREGAKALAQPNGEGRSPQRAMAFLWRGSWVLTP